MTVLMVRYQVNNSSMSEFEGGVEKAISAIENERLEGIRYAVCKLADGVTAVGLLVLEGGVDNPLPDLAAAREFQQNLQEWVVGESPAPERLDVVGAYRLFE